MASLNKAILIGNLGRDPETKTTQAGMTICSFSIATSYKTKSGEEETEWHNIVAFDKLAEICAKYLQKGSPVYIEGRIKTKNWTDKEGNERSAKQIVASSMLMLGKKEGSGGGSSNGGGGSGNRSGGSGRSGSGNTGGKSQPSSQPEYDEPSDYDDNIPF